MDERRLERSNSFARVAQDLEAVSDRLNEIALQELHPYRSAADRLTKKKGNLVEPVGDRLQVLRDSRE